MNTQSYFRSILLNQLVTAAGLEVNRRLLIDGGEDVIQNIFRCFAHPTLRTVHQPTRKVGCEVFLVVYQCNEGLLLRQNQNHRSRFVDMPLPTRKGAETIFANALSLNPVDIQTTEEEFGKSPALSVRTPRVCSQSCDWEAACQLPFQSHFRRRSCQRVLPAARWVRPIRFSAGAGHERCTSIPLSLPLWDNHQHLGVDSGIVTKGDRIVAPESFRETVCAGLHASQQGLPRPKWRILNIMFWLGITVTAGAFVRSCSGCRTHQGSLAKQQVLKDRQPSLSFEVWSANLFSFQAVHSWCTSIPPRNDRVCYWLH